MIRNSTCKSRDLTEREPSIRFNPAAAKLRLRVLLLLLASAETHLALLELQSRFEDKPLNFQVICLQLPPKRGCSPKRVNSAGNKTVRRKNYTKWSPYEEIKIKNKNKTKKVIMPLLYRSSTVFYEYVNLCMLQ